MNISKQHGERGNAVDRSAVSIMAAAVLGEEFRAPRFRYEFSCLGPREADRKSFIDVQLDLQAAISERASPEEILRLRHRLDAFDQEIKWDGVFLNTVVTAGKNDLLDKYFAGSAYTAAWYLSLITSTGYSAIAAGDTMSSHSGWAESSAYSNSTRVAPSFSSASSGSKATSSAVAFTINATDTIKGGFITSNNTKAGTTGILYSAGLFTGGDRSVASGDTLNVSLTLSV